jgi:uncharacterized protein (TIRG00374 family)
MRNRRVALLFFVLGATLLTFQLRHFGISRLIGDAATAGWILVPVILLYAVVHACDAEAWRTILAGESGRPRWSHLYRMVIAGSALNFLTPMVNLGGEPFKLAALAPSLGVSRAAGAVLIRNVARALGLLAFWLAAIVTAWFLLPPERWIRGILISSAIVIVGLMVVLLRAHRRGGLDRWFDRLSSWPLIGPVMRRNAQVRPALERIDRQITGFARMRPRSLALAAGCELLGRAVFVLEYCLIGRAIGIPISYLAAFTIGGLEILVGNLLFFVPYEIGTRETSTVLLFSQLGYPAEAGLFAALVSRLRDMAWIIAGVMLTGMVSRSADIPVAVDSSPAS